MTSAQISQLLEQCRQICPTWDTILSDEKLSTASKIFEAVSSGKTVMMLYYNPNDCMIVCSNYEGPCPKGVLITLRLILKNKDYSALINVEGIDGTISTTYDETKFIEVVSDCLRDGAWASIKL